MELASNKNFKFIWLREEGKEEDISRRRCCLFPSRTEFCILCIHSQRSDSHITSIREEDAEYRGRVAMLSAVRQLWYWHRKRCSPIILDWRRGQFHRENQAMHFYFGMFVFHCAIQFPTFFFFFLWIQMTTTIQLIYFILLQSHMKFNLLPFYLLLLWQNFFVKSYLSSFPIWIGDYNRMVNFHPPNRFYKFSFSVIMKKLLRLLANDRAVFKCLISCTAWSILKQLI